MTEKRKASYLMQPVLHALSVLEEYQGAEGELGVTELSRRLGMHKNSVFRLLATLETRGYIVQKGTSEDYRPGPKGMELALAFRRNSGLLRVARPVLEEASRRCNETVYLGVLRGLEVIYVDAAETTLPVRVSSRIGDRRPVHCTAMGKAQLAFEPADAVTRALAGEPLVRYTPQTITDPAALAGQLAEIRRKGYALDVEEYEAGVRCIGVPVRDYTEQVVAAFSVSGPAYRLPPQRIEKELIPLALEAGAKISSHLGLSTGG